MISGQELRAVAVTAFAAVIVMGRITDQTTGQPLAGVTVRAAGTAGSATAKTSEGGRYRLRGLHPGRAVITVSSNDVPPQRFTVTIGSAATRTVDMTACSTTLDYSCAGPALPSSNGAGGG